jgi:hypothetical protein
MIGFGMGAEYYAANLDKYNGPKFEEHVERIMQSQLTKFSTYLLNDPERIALLKIHAEQEKSGLKVDDPTLRILQQLKSVLDTVPVRLTDDTPVATRPPFPTTSTSIKQTQSIELSAIHQLVKDEHGVLMLPQALPTSKQPAPQQPQKSSPTIVRRDAVIRNPDPSIIGRILVFFYLGYNAMPIVVSRQFVSDFFSLSSSNNTKTTRSLFDCLFVQDFYLAIFIVAVLISASIPK